MYYAVLYDHGSVSRFMGYSSTEYIAQLYAESDDMSNLYVEKFDCDWDEFCEIMNKSYTDDYIGEYEDQLQVMTSNDEETFMINSPRGIDMIV